MKFIAGALPDDVVSPWAGSVHPPAPWIEPAHARPRTPSLARSGNGSWQSSQRSWRPTPFGEPPVALPQIQSNSNFHGLAEAPNVSLTNQRPAGVVHLTTASSPTHYTPTFKRPASFNTPSSPSRHAVNFKIPQCIDLTDEPDNLDPPAKRFKMEIPEQVPEFQQLTTQERFVLRELDCHVQLAGNEDTPIELSPEQEQVVKMALRKNNIFLTGAAGCGKTVTLQEILRRLQKKKGSRNVQVVAPTGIAALPLDGRTTYSFAGVSGNYFYELGWEY
jgi:hypothetical protein